MKNILLLLTVLLLAGCATAPKPYEFPVSPLMATTFSGGKTTITWKAKTGQTYTVYYTDAPQGKLPGWKPLPQGTNIHGTGKQTTITDKPADGSSTRRYMLLTGDQKPY